MSKPKIVRWRGGWVTEMQRRFILSIENSPGVYCHDYEGKSTRDASKWIENHEQQYEDWLNEESALDAAYGIGQE